MELNKDFREFIQLLNEHDVKYLVIGGYAVNFHGYPRYTKDIDFWIAMIPENIDKLLAALKDFGFGSLKLTQLDFMNPENIIQLGYEPFRIDLLLEVEGANFEDSFRQRKEAFIQDLKIDFLNINDLIKVKISTGRPQDLADAHHLLEIKTQQL